MSMTTSSENDDPLSVVLGPTDMSDIDSALEDLLNGGDDEALGNDDFAIDDDEEGDVNDLNNQDLGVQDVSLQDEVTETQAEQTTADRSSDVASTSKESVMAHPLASFPSASASAPKPPIEAATASASTLSNGKSINAFGSNSAMDTMKSFQASVPSMSSVTSSITQLWNQSKPQFGTNISSSTNNLSNPNIATSYNVRNTSSFPTQSNTSSSNINTTNNNTLPNSSSQPPPTLPTTTTGISSLLLSYIDSLLEGERIIMLLSHIKRVSQSSFPLASREGKWWCCAVTLYRIILFPYNDDRGIAENTTKRYMGGGEWIMEHEREAKGMLLQMPLCTIDRVEKIDDEPSSNSNPLSSQNGHGQNFSLVLHGKDNHRYIRFTTSTAADSIRALQTLNTYAFPGRRNLGYLFAFESRRSQVLSPTAVATPTKRRYTFQSEFQDRLQIIPSHHYATAENPEYAICTSYPQTVIVPRMCGNGSLEGKNMLRKCAHFRSEHRFPALTWARSSNTAGIWRCSQPKVGIQGNRCIEDERYLRLMGDGIDVKRGSGLSWSKRFELTGGNEDVESMENTLIHGGSSVSVKILDMRSKTSAMGNRGTGYGYETAGNYPSTSLSFCNITNIHGVRDAYNKISHLSNSTHTSDVQWGSSVEDTKWLHHIRLILQASWVTAFHIHYHNLPVLVHCSHGWDRTSQVAALAQLFLDPYYRTMNGFATLIEKDFMAFGHPFHTRAGHGEGKGERTNNSSGHGGEGQVAPIFIQFLDCVWQIVQQFPNSFEFNLRYILVLSEHIYSCRFGTLLCDNEKERDADASIRERTFCLWNYLEENKRYLQNEFYIHPQDPHQLLLPPLPILLRNVKLWTDRHLKWSPKPSWVGVGKYAEPFLIPDDSSSHPIDESESSLSSVNQKDMMGMRCSVDTVLTTLRKERKEKLKWQQQAEALQKELEELKK